MKNSIFILLAIMIIISCQKNAKVNKAELAEIETYNKVKEFIIKKEFNERFYLAMPWVGFYYYSLLYDTNKKISNDMNIKIRNEINILEKIDIINRSINKKKEQEEKIIESIISNFNHNERIISFETLRKINILLSDPVIIKRNYDNMTFKLTIYKNSNDFFVVFLIKNLYGDKKENKFVVDDLTGLIIIVLLNDLI